MAKAMAFVSGIAVVGDTVRIRVAVYEGMDPYGGRRDVEIALPFEEVSLERIKEVVEKKEREFRASENYKRQIELLRKLGGKAFLIDV